MKLWIGTMAMCGVVGLCGATAQAQTSWFTVAGNPSDPNVDTVQVDPVALSTDGTRKTMNVRVSRSSLRKNWDGVPYRSYDSEVAFDCAKGRAGYLRASFYAEPIWRGTAHATADYAGDPKPMIFRDMAPNPTGRIVRAACQSAAG